MNRWSQGGERRACRRRGTAHPSADFADRSVFGTRRRLPRRWREASNGWAAARLAASTVFVAALAGLPGAQARSSALGAAVRPNVVVILADDARFDSLGRMPNVRTADRCPRRDLHERVRHDIGVLPIESLDPLRAVRAHDGGDPELRPVELPALLRAVEPGGLAPRRRLRDSARRQVPERLHRLRQPPRAARVVRLDRDGLGPGGEVLRLHAERKRSARALRRSDAPTTRPTCSRGRRSTSFATQGAVLPLLRADRTASAGPPGPA